MRRYLEEDLLRATARYWSRFSRGALRRAARGRPRDRRERAGRARGRHDRLAARGDAECPRDGRDPRVLVTGAGGPSGISILRAMAGARVTLLAGDIDPLRGRPVPASTPARRFILPRGDARGFAAALLDAVPARGRRRARADRRQRAAAARARARRAGRGRHPARGRRARRRSPSASTSGRSQRAAAARCACRDTRLVDDDFDAGGGRAAGDRQAAHGQRLARHPCSSSRAEELAALRARRHAARAGAPAGRPSTRSTCSRAPTATSRRSCRGRA